MSRTYLAPRRLKHDDIARSACRGMALMKFAFSFSTGCGVLLRTVLVLAGLSNVVSADPVPSREVRWLESNDAPEALPGTTWGVPWPRGAVAKDASFTLASDDGRPVPVQSWPLATWPDGSLKWTAHAIPAGVGAAAPLRLEPGKPIAPATTVSVTEEPETITVNTGVIECRIRRNGNHFLDSIRRGGQLLAADGKTGLPAAQFPGPRSGRRSPAGDFRGSRFLGFGGTKRPGPRGDQARRQAPGGQRTRVAAVRRPAVFLCGRRCDPHGAHDHL